MVGRGEERSEMTIWQGPIVFFAHRVSTDYSTLFVYVDVFRGTMVSFAPECSTCVEEQA